jgi:hypothetical protein
VVWVDCCPGMDRLRTRSKIKLLVSKSAIKDDDDDVIIIYQLAEAH